MNEPCLRLTTYFGERARVDGEFLADALIDIYARHRVKVSLVMRGIEGFGIKHQMRTDRLLSLSEDLPLVAYAIDHRRQILAAADEVRSLPTFSGLTTVEPTSLIDQRSVSVSERGDTRLTIYIGRGDRAGHQSAVRAAVALLHDRGVAGATVLLGVDGTVNGQRERGRFSSRNRKVPLAVLAIGDGARISALVSDLQALLAQPLITLEQIQICKNAGRLVAPPRPVATQQDSPGTESWQKLMVFTSEQSRHQGRPLHRALVEELHRAGAAGATSLRGSWGYSGSATPHGDTLWQIRRHAPIVVSIIDKPSEIGKWFDLVNEMTDATGLVTAEMVPIMNTVSAPSIPSLPH